MRILIYNWRDPLNPKAGGAEYVTLEHAKAWIRAGNKVTWFSSSFKNAKRNELINNVEIVRFGNLVTVFLFAPLYYFFSKSKFDVVIDQIHGVPFFTPLFVKNKTVIAYIHEVAGRIWDIVFPFPINYIGKFIEKHYFLLYKDIPFWTVSDSTIKDLEKFGISRKQCNLILSPARNKPLNKIPIKDRSLHCLFVSRLVKMKGIEDVIRSMKEIQKVVVDAKLTIIGQGDGMYKQELRDLIKKLSIKNVVFLNYASERKKISFLKKCHFLLHASVKEGWGLVVLEAAACATPTIGYNVAGLRDSIQNGKTGVLLKNNTPFDMAKAVLKLYKNSLLYKSMQENCLRFTSSFTWEEVTLKSLSLLKKRYKVNE